MRVCPVTLPLWALLDENDGSLEEVLVVNSVDLSQMDMPDAVAIRVLHDKKYYAGTVLIAETGKIFKNRVLSARALRPCKVDLNDVEGDEYSHPYLTQPK